MVKFFTQVTLCCRLGSAAATAGTVAPKFGANGKTAAKVEALQQRKAAAANHKSVGTRAEMPLTDIIYNPEGEVKYYYKNAVAYDSWYGDIDIVEEPVTFVYGENNEVYIQDIYTAWYFGTYVKGTIEDNVITIPLPQTAEYYEQYGYGYDVCLMQDVDGEYVVSDIDSVTLLIDEATGTITLDLPGEAYEYALGVAYTDDGTPDSWEYYQEYEPVTDLVVNSVPDDVELSEYTLRTSIYGYNVQVGKDDNYIYIKGFDNTMPSGVIVAAIDGDKATISQNQVVGIQYGSFIFTALIDEETVEYAPADAAYVLDVDWANNTITAAEQQYSFGMTMDPESINYVINVFDPFEIYIQTNFAGTPADPFNLYMDDYPYEYGGFNWFCFTMPNISTEDEVLKNADLYYRIYIDGELYEFEPDDIMYSGLEEPTTEIPYSLNNFYDFYAFDDTERGVGLYMEGYETVGVQAVYKYDGKTTYSNIITLNVETGEETNAIESIVDGVELNSAYYNMQGVKVANPENGIFIKRSTLSDGKVIVKKIVKK